MSNLRIYSVDFFSRLLNYSAWYLNFVGKENMDSLHFSSSFVENKKKIETIERVFSEVLQLDVELPDSMSPSFEVNAAGSPDIGILTFSGTPAWATRRIEQVRSLPDDIVFCVTQGSEVCINKKNRPIEIYDANQAHISVANQAYRIDVKSHYKTLMVAIPSKQLVTAGIDVDKALHHGLSTRMSEMRLLTGYAKMVLSELNNLGADTITQATEYIQKLAVLTLSTTSEREHIDVGRSVKAARLINVKKDIQQNLNNPELNGEWIAIREGISTRYLRELFASDDTSFTEYVLKQRLKCAYEMLTTPRFANWKISEIAYSVGFNDLSYFGRAFKQAYDYSPSSIRNRQH